LAFVCLNWNKKVYQWTTKQPIIINVEDSDDSSSHQEEKDEKIKHHSTPGPAQRTSTTQILTPINQSVSQPDDHHQLIISLKPNKSCHKVIFVRTLPHSPVVLIP
ncbi:hypothetical protein PSTT_09175, partial [Puccinia striiformis]